jgi:glycosyltransferase involved in cell wall biosynthesis
MLERTDNLAVSTCDHDAEAVVRVSVIIPNYQDLENLDRCLTHLEAQTIERDAFEIVVSDNASPVGLAAVEAAVAGRARVVLSREKGAGPTRNVGVAASRGRILAFVDSDCRPDPTFLEEGVRMLDRFDVVGGAIRVDVEKPGRPTPSEAFELVFAFQNEQYIKKKGFSVTAALLVIRTDHASTIRPAAVAGSRLHHAAIDQRPSLSGTVHPAASAPDRQNRGDGCSDTPARITVPLGSHDGFQPKALNGSNIAVAIGRSTSQVYRLQIIRISPRQLFGSYE